MSVPIGKVKLQLADVHQVAFCGAQIEVNAASLEAVAAFRPFKPGKGNEALVDESFPESFASLEQSQGSPLSVAEVRAVMLVRLNSILEARTGLNKTHAEFLAALLNAQRTPALCAGASEHSILNQLASYFVPGTRGAFINGEEEIKVDWVPPGLTVKELASFCAGNAPATALAVLSGHAVECLTNLGDAVASMSCESVQAFTEPFAAKNNDALRPHKGQSAVANNLRVMLEKSEHTNAAKRKVQDDAAFSTIPQYLGPARECVEGALRSLRIELRAAEAGPPSNFPDKPAPFVSQPLAVACASLLQTVCVYAAGALQRTAIVLQEKGAELYQPELQGARAAYEQIRLRASALFPLSTNSAQAIGLAYLLRDAVAVTNNLLALEATVANQVLATKDAIALEASRAAATKKQEALSKRNELAAEAAADPKSPKQKIAAPAKVKEVKEAKGLTFGLGVRRLQRLLGVRAATPAGTPQEAQEVLASVRAALDVNSRADLRFELQAMLTANNQVSRPKMPKGTRDAGPLPMAIREKAFEVIKAVFLAHGAVGIDTPVFERRETLMGKYGEDSKLIYDLADQGGEMLSLRYDLTVPFARFCAVHNVTNIKRYHIGKVYRRDNPAMNKGRFREFYQCDFDIAGAYGPMIPDAEILCILSQILDTLDIGEYKIKINHRKLLDGLLEVCGVPADKFRAVCSAIDKLDKSPWNEVKDEMVNVKGLEPEVADRLGVFCVQKGEPMEMLAMLRTDVAFSQRAGEAFEELGILFRYLEAFGVLQNMSFDLSLARGLDYYTGLIYEAVLTTSDRVGSIAAGGRYDGLVGMFSGKAVPAVGVSIGIERIFAILEDLEKDRQNLRPNQTQVLVASHGEVPALVLARMKLCGELWRAGLKCELVYSETPKAKKQMEFALDNKIPFIAWISQDGIANGTVNLKDVHNKQETEIHSKDIIAELKKRL